VFAGTLFAQRRDLAAQLRDLQLEQVNLIEIAAALLAIGLQRPGDLNLRLVEHAAEI
jgi:hypothetical protein